MKLQQNMLPYIFGYTAQLTREDNIYILVIYDSFSRIIIDIFTSCLALIGLFF